MQKHLHRNSVRAGSSVLAIALALPGLPSEGADPGTALTFENEYLKYVIGADGLNRHFIDRRDGKDHLAHNGPAPFATVRKDAEMHVATAVALSGEHLVVEFGDSGVRAVLRVAARERYLILEVFSLAGDDVGEFAFADIPLSLRGTPEEPFAGCALALNLKTNVRELPRAGSRIRAMCYPRFGFAGAKVAIIGCPQDRLRSVMQEAVAAAEDLPHSPIGGPWALGKAITEGSYLFNFGDLSLEKVDDWIRLARSLGMTQIDFHGGRSFRFGDCRPNPKTYPEGFKSLKAVVDKLHDAGIAAGLHTYAFFIAKDCPWVTPVPDPRLGKDATFTLAEALTAESSTVPVVESTEKMSTVTGFFVRNSVTLHIGDELITYSGIAREPPYAFTGCRRGAHGTRPSAHARGTKVHHLKECFGLFTPDGDSTLLEEVAASTADAFNTCGFDMMYLDALDGEDILGGPENGWHYGSKYVFELWKRLKKPALMEMSTFHHHLWFVRSRLGAWDHPRRSHKAFIDIHCRANEDCRRMFLPAELGWWAFKTWSGPQGEPTFPDDIEYLMCKCLGTDTGFALMGIDPDSVESVPALPRLAGIIRCYEDLRHSRDVPESIKARLRAPGEEFTMIQGPDGKPGFVPVEYAGHRVEGVDGPSNVWRLTNRFKAQTPRFRIEALMAAVAYDAPGNIVLAEFQDPADFPVRAAQSGVTAELVPSKPEGKPWPTSGLYTASSSRPFREGAWTQMEKRFSPPLNLSGHQALGVWVHGDGQGQTLNVQLKSPHHLVGGIGDHYVIIDFTGWRYFELIEPEGKRYSEHSWPYGHMYAIYRESVQSQQVETLGIWYNNLPPGGKVACALSPIKAIPLVTAKLVNPSITIGGKAIVFPVEIESGWYLEFNSMSECTLFGPKGQAVRKVTPEGEVPGLEEGENEVRFHCESSAGARARAKVTVISEGDPLPWQP